MQREEALRRRKERAASYAQDYKNVSWKGHVIPTNNVTIPIGVEIDRTYRMTLTAKLMGDPVCGRSAGERSFVIRRVKYHTDFLDGLIYRAA